MEAITSFSEEGARASFSTFIEFRRVSYSTDMIYQLIDEGQAKSENNTLCITEYSLVRTDLTQLSRACRARNPPQTRSLSEFVAVTTSSLFPFFIGLHQTYTLAHQASRHVHKCHVFDIEAGLPGGVKHHYAPSSVQLYLPCSEAAVTGFEADAEAVMEKQPRYP